MAFMFRKLMLSNAGTDTTSGCLANVLFHLVEHPDTMTNLITEIRGTFEDVSEIRIGQKLNNCKLLSACIDESLRLSPIVGGCLMRQVGPGGITVNGRLVPEGVDVGVPHHVVMRNPKYYTEPLEFKPRRWLQTETTEKELALARSAFCPFGIGPTGCIGRAWAVVEMKLTLANILFEYDLMKDMDKPELSVMQRLHERDRCGVDRFIITNQGPYIRFRPAKLG